MLRGALCRGIDESAFKLIYLAVLAAEKRWTRPPKGWSEAINQLAIHFEDRLPTN